MNGQERAIAAPRYAFVDGVDIQRNVSGVDEIAVGRVEEMVLQEHTQASIDWGTETVQLVDQENNALPFASLVDVVEQRSFIANDVLGILRQGRC